MHEWVDYIHNHVNENGLWMTNYQYGDWLALDREMGDKKRWSHRCLLCGKRLLLYVTELVAKTAHVLGKYEEAAYYEVLRERRWTLSGKNITPQEAGSSARLRLHARCLSILTWHMKG